MTIHGMEHINDKRFRDLRIAVCEFKKIDPVDIVFLSFLNEQRFEIIQSLWQIDLMSGIIWDEILEICNTAITVDDLNGTTEDIVKCGFDLMCFLKQKEEELAAAEYEEEEEIVE